ncbi:MAG: restriction endonuclease subunit S [Pseudodesulfovibrio sp.]|uniref:restriction endonuclease subunit S n=1 Tax=Pseudodesulfovibrio sp. TaxID=2035812 RepID=UPI003D0F9ED8
MSTQSLKPGWKMVKFGDVAQNVAVRVDPADAKTDVYVGLEHLDPSTIHLRQWGHPTDVTGQKLAFKKGDVIFGRRRAYQRKLAVAEFDGICSAHAMVVRAKPKMILPKFLPFFLQSDMFMERAIEISVGSLSPTINWKTLKVQEFPLPPIDEQKRIAEILWAADEAFNQHQQSNDNLMSVKRTLLNRLTVRGIGQQATQHTRLGEIPVHWRLATVEDVTSICQYGLSIPLNESGQYPILRMMNYDDGRIIANDLKYVDLDDSDFNSFKVHKGDILFNRTNSADLVGKVGIFDLEGDYVFASYLVRLRADEDQILPDFLNYYLNSGLGQRRLLAYATPGVSQTNISAGNLKKVLVPLPPMEEQKQIVEVLNNLELRKHLQRNHVAEAQKCLAALINNLVGATIAEEVSHV